MGDASSGLGYEHNNRDKKDKGILSNVGMTGEDSSMARARKMLDMSQLDSATSAGGSDSPNAHQVPSTLSPSLNQVPSTVAIPTMMRQPMPIMPTSPLPPSSLRQPLPPQSVNVSYELPVNVIRDFWWRLMWEHASEIAPNYL